MLDLIRDPGVM